MVCRLYRDCRRNTFPAGRLAVAIVGVLPVGDAGIRSVTRIDLRLPGYCDPSPGGGRLKVDASAGLMSLRRDFRAGGSGSSGESPMIPA